MEQLVTEPDALTPQFEFADPVFVLCNGRSGSTLLRFLLDGHPELACPPETNLPALCAQLATVWSLIEGAPLSPNRGDEPPEIPDAAIGGIRMTMDRMVGSYLVRRGKNRYCDKSLGTARYAELLLRVYPEARFLCLYRHPMDMMASAMEACPWGLNGYGFDPYIATTPGNALMALARFWADNTSATLAVEERFADRCMRVRYEDMVYDPEGIASAIFDFLGVAPAPGISETCFSMGRERFGPADYKIWYTSKVSSDSIGRGWSLPVGMIAPQVLGMINEFLVKLGYLPVDGDWGTSAPPADLRIPIADPATDVSSEPAEVTAPASEAPVRSLLLGDALAAGLAGTGPKSLRRREELTAETMVAVWIPADPHELAEHWLVDFKEGRVSYASRAAQESSNWDVVGSASAWEKVIGGTLNLSVALRTCQLRYCDDDEAGQHVSDGRIGILAELLALATWE